MAIYIIYFLYRTYEPIRDRYGNIHNLFFLQNLMKEIRKSIIDNDFDKFKKEFFKEYKVNNKKKTTFSYGWV